MAIELDWLDENQKGALVYSFPEQWAWQDFYDIKTEADKWLDLCDHDVALLFDMAKTRSIPPGALAQGRYLIGKAHPRGKPIILIGKNRMIGALLNMATRFNPNIGSLIRTASTLDEAREVVTKLHA
jgi:hypothetical protein